MLGVEIRPLLSIRNAFNIKRNAIKLYALFYIASIVLRKNVI